MVTKKNKEKKVVQLHADSKKLIKKTADSLTCYKEYFRLIISIIISNKSKVKSLKHKIYLSPKSNSK